MLKDNEYQEILLVKFLREFLTITTCLSHATTNAYRRYSRRRRDQNKCKFTVRTLKSHEIRSTLKESTLGKLLCTLKDGGATKIITILFMKSTIVTVKQSTSVNLNGVQMNTIDPSGIAILKGMKLQNTVEKQIIALAGTRRKLLIRKAG